MKKRLVKVYSTMSDEDFGKLNRTRGKVVQKPLRNDDILAILKKRQSKSDCGFFNGSPFNKKMDRYFRRFKPRIADDVVDKCYRCFKRHTKGYEYNIDGKTYIICSFCYQWLKKKPMPVHLSYYPWIN